MNLTLVYCVIKGDGKRKREGGGGFCELFGTWTKVEEPHVEYQHAGT